MNIVKFMEIFSLKGRAGIHKFIVFKASKQSFSGKRFHKLCDGKSPLIIMIYLQTGLIFGVYYYRPLKSTLLQMVDPLCGAFSFFSDTLNFYTLNNNIVRYNKWGFSFGQPENIFINLDSIERSVCNIDMTFQSPIG